MAGPIDVYLEAGTKRVFAGALDWPGWCRSGRDSEAALDSLATYARRYAKAIGRAGGAFTPPKDASGLRIVERVAGTSTTDFGAPGVSPSSDDRPLGQRDTERLITLLRATWTAFDRTARAADGVSLARGPRGGGRELGAILRHVLEAEAAYLAKLGAPYRKLDPGTDVANETGDARTSMVDLVASRAAGEPPPRTPRRGSLWSPRYAVRRSAWHALDHAWEIEDRMER